MRCEIGVQDHGNAPLTSPETILAIALGSMRETITHRYRNAVYDTSTLTYTMLCVRKFADCEEDHKLSSALPDHSVPDCGCVSST